MAWKKSVRLRYNRLRNDIRLYIKPVVNKIRYSTNSRLHNIRFKKPLPVFFCDEFIYIKYFVSFVCVCVCVCVRVCVLNVVSRIFQLHVYHDCVFVATGAHCFYSAALLIFHILDI